MRRYFGTLIGAAAIWAACPAPGQIAISITTDGAGGATTTFVTNITVNPAAAAPAAIALGDATGPESGRLEKATYLGITSAPADKALREQLGLPKGVGLVVEYVDKDGPAAGKLQENDVLHKLNDQLLVNHDQLATLIRTFKAGDEVTLSAIRKGKAVEVKIKLGEKQLPPLDSQPWRTFFMRDAGGAGGANPFQLTPEQQREWTDRFRSFWGNFTNNPSGFQFRRGGMRRPGGGQSSTSTRFTMQGAGAGGQAASTFTSADGEHSLTVTSTADGRKTLTACDAAGKVVFSGPVNTPDELAKVPADIRAKFDGMAKMQAEPEPPVAAPPPPATPPPAPPARPAPPDAPGAPRL